jgi:hypothetical protein
MRKNTHMSGMLGVYLTAAELTRRGFIVSPTSRSAAGADLLVTDQSCQRAWSVQVKTNNTKRKGNWILKKSASALISRSHVYVFVQLKSDESADYRVVRSKDVAAKMREMTVSTGGASWYLIDEAAINRCPGGWKIFGNPNIIQGDGEEISP